MPGVQGDLLAAEQNLDAIVHGRNRQHATGAGIAKSTKGLALVRS